MKTNLKLHKTFVAFLALFLTVGILAGCGKSEEQKKEEATKFFTEGLNAVKQGNFDEGIKAYKKAANLGDTDAMYNIGICYYRDKNDPQEALKWFLKAAEKGDVDAQVTVGLAYNLGENWAKGIKQDHKKAYKWFLKAAEQGNATAQRNVGFYCTNFNEETGVPFDRDEARKWYRKAADQGDEGAIQALDIMDKADKNNNEALDLINKYL